MANMKKRNRHQRERKVDTGIKGGASLWDRINGDPAYLIAKREIQTRYGLPLPYDIRLNHQKWQDWTGVGGKSTNQRAGRGRAFLEDVYALFKKFEVPDTWHEDFIADLAGLPSGDSLETRGAPKFHVYQDVEGNWKWECTITPETDLTNPLVLESIRRQQKEYAGDPPRPAKDKDHPRKLDWRPVHDWHKSHPLFTIEEVAEKIAYAPRTVRRKFAELERNK
jgi:hypothetical protein